MTDAPTASPDPGFALTRAVRFVKARWLLITAVSAVLLVPCFWHMRIEAGDLASHTYNAWLAQLIEAGTGKRIPVRGIVVFPGWFVEPMSETWKVSCSPGIAGMPRICCRRRCWTTRKGTHDRGRRAS